MLRSVRENVNQAVDCHLAVMLNGKSAYATMKDSSMGVHLALMSELVGSSPRMTGTMTGGE